MFNNINIDFIVTALGFIAYRTIDNYKYICVSYSISIVFGNNSIYVVSYYTPVVLLQPLQHHFYIAGWCNIIFCAYHVCILWDLYVIYQNRIQPPSIWPNQTKYVVESIDIYLQLTVVYYHTYSTRIAPCRVVHLPPHFFEKWVR